jgi:hypothetical protein
VFPHLKTVFSRESTSSTFNKNSISLTRRRNEIIADKKVIMNKK